MENKLIHQLLIFSIMLQVILFIKQLETLHVGRQLQYLL